MDLGDLKSEPQGITLQYVRGTPTGQLLGLLVPTSPSLEKTEVVQSISIGRTKELQVARDSWLLMRANLPVDGLNEIRGAYPVRINRQLP